MFLTHFPFHKGFIHKLILIRAFSITQFDEQTEIIALHKYLKKKEDVLSSYKQRNFGCISGFYRLLSSWMIRITINNHIIRRV